MTLLEYPIFWKIDVWVSDLSFTKMLNVLLSWESGRISKGFLNGPKYTLAFLHRYFPKAGFSSLRS